MGRQTPLAMGGGQGSVVGRLFSGLVLFGLIVWVVKDPAGAATAAKHLVGLAEAVVEAFSTFIAHLSS